MPDGRATWTPSRTHPMSLEDRFDVPLVSALALREKAIQQNYRPIIAVHKWFARRPGTLFRGLLLSEFVDGPLSETFFHSNQLSGRRIADPFMGGGTPLIEANRLGADVVGWDINPMAWWIVGRELEHLDLDEYSRAGNALVDRLRAEVGSCYETKCSLCEQNVPVKYFLWVKTQPCRGCARNIDLFPGYLLATNARHPSSVLLCGRCGELNEVADRRAPGRCRACRHQLRLEGPARRSAVTCPDCGTLNKFPLPTDGPLEHRMFALEYHCPGCRPSHRGRFFKKPDGDDLRRYEAARRRWLDSEARYVPDDPIPRGDESSRLHRWGYERYRQMFNPRQLLSLELSCRLIAAQTHEGVRNALATNLSDLLRYNNLLVRYDTASLKALDLFSVHGFPVGLVRCESNLPGIAGGNGQPIGSGGWTNILKKYRAAKEYCDRPFEVAPGSRTRTYATKEWIGDRSPVDDRPRRIVDLRCASATEARLAPQSLDGVFTDPPHYDSVQYAELMDFCYVWLRRLAGSSNAAFASQSTRHTDELTGNDTAGRDLAHFTDGLSAVYMRLAAALKPEAPFVFTYHHNRETAYHPIAVAILDAGLVPTATLPCPAEMSGSIHISGTKSSIIDTVFVCRIPGGPVQQDMACDLKALARIVFSDLKSLRSGGVKPTPGDARCIALGHLTRAAILRHHATWDRTVSTNAKLTAVAETMSRLPQVDDIVSLSLSATDPKGFCRVPA